LNLAGYGMKIKVHILLREGCTPAQVEGLIERAALTGVNRRRLAALGILTAMVDEHALASLRTLPGVQSVTPDGEQELAGS